MARGGERGHGGGAGSRRRPRARRQSGDATSSSSVPGRLPRPGHGTGHRPESTSTSATALGVSSRRPAPTTPWHEPRRSERGPRQLGSANHGRRPASREGGAGSRRRSGRRVGPGPRTPADPAPGHGGRCSVRRSAPAPRPRPSRRRARRSGGCGAGSCPSPAPRGGHLADDRAAVRDDVADQLAMGARPGLGVSAGDDGHRPSAGFDRRRVGRAIDAEGEARR